MKLEEEWRLHGGKVILIETLAPTDLTSQSPWRAWFFQPYQINTSKVEAKILFLNLCTPLLDQKMALPFYTIPSSGLKKKGETADLQGPLDKCPVVKRASYRPTLPGLLQTFIIYLWYLKTVTFQRFC